MRLVILFTFLLSGCFNEKIDITTEYIINESWSNKAEKIGANSIEIVKLKLKKDSMINSFTDLSQGEILNKLEEDTSFGWVANVKIQKGGNYNTKKVLFNKDNGFDWWGKDGIRKTKIIGKLEKNSWYKISRLSYYYFIIYIDSVENVHRFVINQTNY